MALHVLVLGSSGMAGHIISLYLLENTNCIVSDVGPRKKIFEKTRLCDIFDPDSILKMLSEEKPDVIVNCIGVLVNAAEQRKKEAVWINAYLPHLLAQICHDLGCKLIHISTDCVFSGKNGPYQVGDPYDGQDFYGRSKALGEIRDELGITIRTSIIGPELRSAGTGLFSWFMRQKAEIQGYRHALWSGVTTLELAKCIAFVIKSSREISGVVHYSVPGGISKYELLRLFETVWQRGLFINATDGPRLDKRLIGPSTSLGIVPYDYEDQMHELKRWMESHPLLYTERKDPL